MDLLEANKIKIPKIESVENELEIFLVNCDLSRKQRVELLKIIEKLANNNE